MPGEITNTSRTERIYRTMLVYRQHTECDEEDALADMLADLMHLSDEYGHDFNRELERARNNYEAEKMEEAAL